MCFNREYILDLVGSKAEISLKNCKLLKLLEILSNMHKRALILKLKL